MKFIQLLVFMCLFLFRANAQSQDSVMHTTLTLAGLYNSNISYYGQSTNEKLPYALINATLRFPYGLYFSAGSYKLLNYGRGLSETDLGIGIERDFNDKLTLGAAYTRSFFPANSPLLQASNENNLNISAAYSWTLFKSEINADYAFGQQTDTFLSLVNSKEISLGSFINGENTIYIEPGIELVAGTKHFYETYIVTKGKRDKAKGRALQNPGNSRTPITSIVESSSFNLLSYNLKLPLSFSRANYIAEINYQFSILGPGAEAELKKRQSFFGLAFYYQF